MQILSAADAISPAFARTKLVLFTPFRWGRSWKLAVSAYLTRMGLLFLPFLLFTLPFVPMAKRTVGGWLAATIIVGAIVLTGLYAWIFALCSRLQFAMFDIILNRGDMIAPAWRKYGAPSRRWALAKGAAGTILTVLCGIPAMLYIWRLVLVMQAHQAGKDFFPPFSSFLFLWLCIGFGPLFLLLIANILEDFIVPSLALEDTTLSEAFRRFRLFARAEPGQLAVYTALKAVLGSVGYYAAALLAEIAFLLGMAVLALVGLLIGAVIHLLGVPWSVLQVIGIVLAIPLYLAFFFYAFPLVIGTLMTFLDAYALYFLGGRYPLLGDLLDRSTPPPPDPPPPPAYAWAPPYPPPPYPSQ